MKTSSLSLIVLTLLPSLCIAWSNGPSGNAQTDKVSECSSPPYSTHDWVADQGLMLLPANERAWIMPHRTMYLLGTEAPDNRNIPSQCNSPNTGYDDRRKGHSVEWKSDMSGFASGRYGIKDRAADRAQEEYGKAVSAYKQGDLNDAAFYLGAMAHYIGDVSQYGHSVPFEEHHSDYETWAKNKTDSFTNPTFQSYIQLDRLVRRTPYTAVKIISKATAAGSGDILSATKMDASYSNKDQAYMDSVGASLNLGANTIADVLHSFFLNIVEE